VWEPLLLEPLPTVTDEPEPPGETVVLPLTLPPPAVIEVELLLEPSPPRRVTTRHGLPFTTTVPSELDETETLPARAGTALRETRAEREEPRVLCAWVASETCDGSRDRRPAMRRTNAPLGTNANARRCAPTARRD
jgi:hypothetical protein